MHGSQDTLLCMRWRSIIFGLGPTLQSFGKCCDGRFGSHSSRFVQLPTCASRWILPVRGPWVTCDSTRHPILYERQLNRVGILLNRTESLPVRGPWVTCDSTRHPILYERQLNRVGILLNRTESLPVRGPWVTCDSTRHPILYERQLNRVGILLNRTESFPSTTVRPRVVFPDEPIDA
jgi:hypothetical protein